MSSNKKLPGRRATGRANSISRSKATAGNAIDAVIEEIASTVPGGKLVYKLLRTLGKHGHQVSKDNTKDALEAAAAEAAAQEEAALVQLTEEVADIGRRVTLALRAINEAGRHPDLELRQALGRFFFRVCHVDPDKVRAFEIADTLSRLTSFDYEVLKLLARVQRENLSVRAGNGATLRQQTTEPGRGVATLAGLQLMSPQLRGLDAERMASIGQRLSSFGLAALPPKVGVSSQIGGPRLHESRAITPLGLELIKLTEPTSQ